MTQKEKEMNQNLYTHKYNMIFDFDKNDWNKFPENTNSYEVYMELSKDLVNYHSGEICSINKIEYRELELGYVEIIVHHNAPCKTVYVIKK